MQNDLLRPSIQSAFQNFAYLIPLPVLIQLTGQKLLLPFYHAIGNKNTLPHIHHLYTPRSAQQFEEDLDFFLNHFQPVSLTDIFDAIYHQKPLPKKSFHLSFDDGLREVYDVVFPILKRKGVAATIFLNADFVDNRDLFFRYKASLIIDFLKKNKKETLRNKTAEMLSLSSFDDHILFEKILDINFQNKNVLDKIALSLEMNFNDFLKETQPYLTAPQIKKLQKNGFTFGAHSIDHPMYADLTLEEQIWQTEKSIQFIQQYFPEKIKSFSFPFTDFKVGKKFFQHLEEKKIADLTFGCAGLKKNTFPFHLQRVPMEGSTFSADRIVASEYFYYIVKSFFGKNRIKRQ